jgi:hypothetical protein
MKSISELKSTCKLLALVGSSILGAGLVSLSFSEALSPIPVLPGPLAAVAVILGFAVLFPAAIVLYLLGQARSPNSDIGAHVSGSPLLKALDFFTFLGSVILCALVIASFISPTLLPAISSNHWAFRLSCVPVLLGLGWRSYKSLRSRGHSDDAA